MPSYIVLSHSCGGGEGGWCEVARGREGQRGTVAAGAADLDDHSRREAAGEQQVGDARQVEVVGSPVGPGEGKDGEKHRRDDGGDNCALELPGAVLLVDEEHHRGEVELAQQVDHLWPEPGLAREVGPRTTAPPHTSQKRKPAV